MEGLVAVLFAGVEDLQAPFGVEDHQVMSAATGGHHPMTGTEGLGLGLDPELRETGRRSHEALVLLLTSHTSFLFVWSFQLYQLCRI